MEAKPIATKTEVLISLFLSLFYIVFLWGMWSREVFALGINLTVYLVLITLFFVWRLREDNKYSTSDLTWIAPLLLIALSFSIYENPFFKLFALLVFPVALSVFYTYAWVEKKKEIDWDTLFISKVVIHILSFLTFLNAGVRLLFSTVYNKEETEAGTVKRVLIGILILSFSLLIVIPLLSSADPLFASKLKPFYEAITNVLSAEIVAKIIVFTVLSIGTITALIAWGRPHQIENSTKEVNRDTVITSIVLGGIFVVYILFLWIQIDRLWVGTLPVDFKETESLVKSGFWQLLLLSIINLGIFFFLYRKTDYLGQKVLGLFSLASILLLVSSAQRMILYVTYHGFSYEKFYASYTVLFCMVLFLWLISRLFVSKKTNIVKFLAFQFLWMFSLASIFPVEFFIIKSNMALVTKPNSKIQLFEMTMLSPDVLTQVKKYKEEGKLKEEILQTVILPNGEIQEVKVERDWSPWIEKQEKIVQSKKWYEYTLSTYIID
ncbi:MAG: DUF4153 domain-containing protein [Minisyncoccia bacterium]